MKYIMKNYKVDNFCFNYVLYDEECLNSEEVTLTPNEAKKLNLEPISPMQMFNKRHNKEITS